MKLPNNDYDPETKFFLNHFDEEPGKTIEIGANDTPISQLLAEAGFDTYGIDLFPYQFPSKHKHISSNFLNLADDFWAEHRGTFDVAVSISAIEHFGLGAYGEPVFNIADVIAMRYIWDLLKVGGVCYIIVPFGGRFVTAPHWRVYSWDALKDRIIHNFAVNQMVLQVSEAFGEHKAGDLIDLSVALAMSNGEPNCSVLLKMQKS